MSRSMSTICSERGKLDWCQLLDRNPRPALPTFPSRAFAVHGEYGGFPRKIHCETRP